MFKKFSLIITLISVLSSLFCFRYYDPQIARWMAVDPVDEFYSPYVFFANNPTNFVDPDGSETKVAIVGGNVTGSHACVWIERANSYIDENQNTKYESVLYDPYGSYKTGSWERWSYH